MVSALRRPWAPTDDWALIEMQVRAVGTADTPLVVRPPVKGAPRPGDLPLPPPLLLKSDPVALLLEERAER